MIQQLCIFLENRSGRLSEVTKVLGDNGINMNAFNISESSDFGIMRVVVSDARKAYEVLSKSGFAVTVSEVICLQLPHVPGALSKVLAIFAAGNISVEYMYAFATGDKAKIIICPDNLEACVRLLSEQGLEILNSVES